MQCKCSLPGNGPSKRTCAAATVLTRESHACAPCADVTTYLTALTPFACRCAAKVSTSFVVCA
jgi:hypothetical protein